MSNMPPPWAFDIFTLVNKWLDTHEIKEEERIVAAMLDVRDLIIADAAQSSLAPVVGAEDGEHARNDYPLPVATAEPGPGGTDDDPGRASTEETTS